MKIVKIFTFIFCFSLFISSPIMAQEYASRVIIVKLKIDNSLPINAGSASNSYIPSYISTLNSLGAKSIETPFKLLEELMFVRQILFEENANIDSIVAILNQDKNFEYVTKLHIPIATKIYIPNEPQTDKQWYFKNININNSWDFNNGVKVRIAVIDNAIRTTHEDIADNLFTNKGEIPNNGIDDDNNGYIDDVHGYDFGDNDNNTNPPSNVTATYFSHGTHVAGIISASNVNNRGLASLCPNAELLPIKVVSDNPKFNNDMLMTGYLKGLEYAIKMDAKIINCSWGITLDPGESSPVLEDFINIARARKIIVVAAAGNNDKDNVFVPASYPYVISVGSTNQDNKKSTFSNFGSIIDVMAPGEDIYSTLGTGDHDYGAMNGTSMAAPIVSSFIGQILSQFPYTAFPDITTNMENIIKENCVNIDAQNPSYKYKLGNGIIDIDKTFVDLYTRTTTSSYNRVSTDLLKIYPNPSQGVFYIKNAEIPSEQLLIKIYDLSGKEIEAQSPKMNGELSFTNLQAGAYIVAVNHNNILVHHEKILIVK